MDTREIRILDYQLITSLVVIITIIVSMILTYNERLDLNGDYTFFDKDCAKKIGVINRIIIFIVFILYLYYNYQSYCIAKEKNKNLMPFLWQIAGSYFALVASIISLIVVVTASGVSEVENPTI